MASGRIRIYLRDNSNIFETKDTKFLDLTISIDHRDVHAHIGMTKFTSGNITGSFRPRLMVILTEGETIPVYICYQVPWPGTLRPHQS